MSVFNGDTAVGAGAAEAVGSCAVDGGAGIVGWNRGNAATVPADAKFAGAGTQLAAFAQSKIQDHAAALGGQSGNPGAPSGLAFANSPPSITLSGSIFGGNFGSAPVCPDYREYKKVATEAPAPGSTLGGRSLASGSQVIYVEGDVTISGDIFYSSTTWGSINDIPNFILVADGGNIYIRNSVRRLDGTYIALPSSSAPSKGIIYTCDNGSSGPPTIGPSLVSSCGNQLTVNGAFVARQVQFWRTSGSLGQARTGQNGQPGNSPAAEVFVGSPEQWIAPKPLVPRGYDSIISLPPVL
jgi:hypothetical protein